MNYLTKPFDTKELQIRIKNLISERRKLQRLFSDDKIVAVREKEIKLSGLDEKFMKKVKDIIEMHISEEEFSIEDFGKEVGMSRMQIHRKLKALTGKSATHFIRSVKLFKAREMIEKQEETISEIAYSLGFSSPAYFTRCFKEEYGYPPSDLVD
jgi:AraC-like DNA-binding protein